MSSFRPIVCVQQQTHRVFFIELTEFGAELSEVSHPKHRSLATVFCPFPKNPTRIKHESSEVGKAFSGTGPLFSEKNWCLFFFWKSPVSGLQTPEFSSGILVLGGGGWWCVSRVLFQ